MDLNEVAVFIKVIQAGSFSLAAKQLGMPNSTVSAKVSSLEKRLGVTLIQRTTRKLNITPAGQSYFKRCIQGLEEIEAAELEIAASQGEPQGVLKLTAPVELGSRMLPAVISDFIARYPKVTVDVFLSDQTVDLLAEGVDLAIRGGELKDSTLIAKRLGSNYFAPFASPKYVKEHGSPAHPKELRSHQCLHFNALGRGEWRLTNSKGATVSVAIPSRVLANDLNLVKTLAMSGCGIALMPTFHCYADVKAGKLVRVLPDWQSGTTPIHFVYPAQRFVSAKLSAFIDLASDRLKRSLAEFEI